MILVTVCFRKQTLWEHKIHKLIIRLVKKQLLLESTKDFMVPMKVIEFSFFKNIIFFCIINLIAVATRINHQNS